MNRIALSFAFAVLLGACSTSGHVAPTSDRNGIVVGYIDMRDAPSVLDIVIMKRQDRDTPPYLFHVEDGVFFQLDVEPGRYKFTRFGGSSFLKQTAYDYKFPAERKGELDVTVHGPAIHYVGAWRFRNTSQGLLAGVLTPGSFDIERISSPTEREILQKVLGDASNVHWKAMIRARIEALERGAR